MTIFIYKHKRTQSKETMATMAIVNSNLAESPFFVLEDTMTDKEARKSRARANKIMRELCPGVDWHVHLVHHIDGNPLNNALVNLKIMKFSEHSMHHASLIPSKATHKKHTPKWPKTRYWHKTGDHTMAYEIGDVGHFRYIYWKIVQVKYNAEKNLTTIKLQRKRGTNTEATKQKEPVIHFV